MHTSPCHIFPWGRGALLDSYLLTSFETSSIYDHLTFCHADLPCGSELSAREQPVAAAPGAPSVDQSVYASHPPNFANHLQPASEGPGIKSEPGTSTLPHGYNHQQLPQGETHIHPELRSEPPPTAPVYAPIPNMIPQGAGVPHPNQGVPMPNPPVAVAPAVGSTETGDTAADGRKAKRELSQSKRAAQNRAAQVSKQSPLLT